MQYCCLAEKVAFSFGNGDFSWMSPGFVSTESDLMKRGGRGHCPSFFQCNEKEKESLFGSKGLYLCGKNDNVHPNEIEVFQLK